MNYNYVWCKNYLRSERTHVQKRSGFAFSDILCINIVNEIFEQIIVA